MAVIKTIAPWFEKNPEHVAALTRTTHHMTKQDPISM
jgi:hypothetical protein